MTAAHFFRKILLSLIISVTFFAILELLLLLLNIPDVGIYRGDPNYVWWLRSNLYKEVQHIEENTKFLVITDEHGFRIAERGVSQNWNIEKTDVQNEFILALGCSTTFGWGVEGNKVWTHLLSEKKEIGIPVVNGGIPGWSTFQAVRGLLETEQKIRKPKLIVLSYGVRDQQLSYQDDRSMNPTPFMFRLQLARLIRQGRLASGNKMMDSKAMVYRVSVDDYRDNIDKISAIWTDVPILHFVFPNLNSEISGHDQVLIDKGGIHFTNMFGAEEFFKNDRIHINEKGNQHLSDVLVPSILKLLSKSEHIE